MRIVDPLLVALLMTAVGLFLAGFGGFLATNHRGFVDFFLAESKASVRWLTRIPPWRWIPMSPEPRPVERLFVRASGWIFMVVGSIVAANGVVDVVTGSSGVPAPRQPWHPMNVITGVIAVIMVNAWFVRRPPIRSAWRRGGLSRGVVTVIYTGLMVFATGVAIASETGLVIGWTAGALAVVVFIALGLWQPPAVDGTFTADQGYRGPPPPGRDADGFSSTRNSLQDQPRGDDEVHSLHSRLLDDLDAIVALLRRCREDHWAEWIDRVRRRIAGQDANALESLLSVYSGHGSFNDLALRPRQQPPSEPDDLDEANQQLARLRSRTWRTATAIRDALHQ